MVVAIVICHRTGILFFSCLDNFQSDHYSRTPIGSILDLTVIFWFPVDCNIHWQAMVDPMAALQDIDSSTQISSDGKNFVLNVR